MQIEDLLVKNNTTDKNTNKAAEYIAEYKKNESGASLMGVDTDTKSQGIVVEKGEGIMQSPVYNKKTIKTAAEAYEKQLQSGAGDKNLQNEMILAAHTMSKQDYKEMVENGFDPADTDSKIFVTIADKIRIQLAKAGKDMSITGGISKAAIEAVSGSAAEANSIESAIKQSSGESVIPQSAAPSTADTISDVKAALQNADLPTDNDTMQQIKETVSKAAELPDTISADTSTYLLKNDQQPTVDNVLKAEFAGNTDMSQQTDLSDKDIENLLPQITGKIEEAGLDADQDQISNAVFLLKNNVPLTAANIQDFNILNGAETVTIQELPQAITDAVIEGKSPLETMAVKGFSDMDKARDAADVVSKATDQDLSSVIADEKPLTIENLKQAMVDNSGSNRSTNNSGSNNALQASASADELKLVSAKRQLEEARLVMTTEANYRLIKQGISIDTTKLSDIVEQLKAQEKTLGEALFPDDITKAALFDDTTDVIESAKQAPSALISSYKALDGIFSSKLSEIASGKTTNDLLKKAGSAYETLSTEVRPDLGDSIQKAFANVDDILDETGLEANDENRRAVRILAYNNREITEENASEVKAADEKVQKVFDNLKPGVVMKLIKNGENPLQMSMDELYDKTEEIKKVLASSGSSADKDATDYADFLWKAENSGKITDDEKQSFIGLYRLMNQIDVTDGAPIGALLSEGADITMENLMQAVRSTRNEGMDYSVDDSFSTPDSSITNSITDQISTAFEKEKEFQTRRTRVAKSLATPERLQAIGGEKAYMPMSPDRLASALEAESSNTDESETDEQLYQAKKAEIEQAVAEADERTYQILNDSEVAVSPLNIQAVNQVIKNHRFFYTRLYGENGRQPFDVLADSMGNGDGLTLDEGWEKLINDFSEALKSPQEMAEAQKELYDTAENVLRKSLADDAAAGKIDIRLIQQSVRQLSVMKELSQKKEEYAIPVMVGDELGNMNLKIVRGKDEKKGLVDIAMDSDTTGEVYARFKASEDGGIDGKITTNRRTSRETLSENLGMLAEKIQGKLGQGSVSLVTEYDGRTDASAVFYNTDDPGFETTDDKTNEIQTKTLYAISRSFVETIGELFQ